jgi:DNA-binding beta-propeller fold protein YncE
VKKRSVFTSFLIILIGLAVFVVTSCATPGIAPPSAVRQEEKPPLDSRPESTPESTPPAAHSTPPESPNESTSVSEPKSPSHLSTKPIPPEPVVPEPAEAVPAMRDALADLKQYTSFPEPRDLALRIFPQDARVEVLSGDTLETLTPSGRDKDVAWYRTDSGAVWLDAQGYLPAALPLPAGSGTVEAKLERPSDVIRKLSELPTGYQPKSVRFSPDGRFIYVTHLGDFTALSQYSVDPFRKIRDLNVPEEYRGDSAFVETLVLEGRGEIWVTQMSRNAVHIFDMNTGRYLDTIDISGHWPKVLLANRDESRVYVSCWTSEAVIEIDTASRTELRALSTSGIPRGLAFGSDESELLAAIFSSAAVDRIDLATGELVAVHDAAPGRNYAMRHIVHDERRGEYYITAMGYRRVYRLSENGEWLGYWDVGDKPNTCAITPDGRWLFVSCRGPNNPDIGYLYKGYEFGKVFVIDLESGESADWIWGRDQTTGLDVSPDGHYLAFSNFLSHSLELYEVAP